MAVGLNTHWFLSMFLYDGPVATKLHISMSYHCMRPHHLYACVRSVRCVWLWQDMAFSKKSFFFEKSILERAQKLTNSNFGIWSIAQKRNPNLSYASKRDCESIAPHTKRKTEIAKILQTFVRASGRDKTLAVELFFCGQKNKI